MKNFSQLLFALILICLTACAGDNDLALPTADSDTGVAGSYARFIAVGDYMYIVNTTGIKTFDLSAPASPEQIDDQEIGERIESIFHYDGLLFIGSGAGLFIYQIGQDGKPVQLSATAYFNLFDTWSCDPVVANQQHAFVTLNSVERVCNGLINVNELRIYDITDLENPNLLVIYPMTSPKGVGLDGNTLFVCDHTAGLKIYDVSNVLDITLIKQFTNFTAYDVITLNGLLLVVGPDNVYQFDYSDLDNIQLLAEIPYGR